MSTKTALSLIVGACCLLIGIVFFTTGLYDTRIDATVYIAQIQSFEAGTPFAVSPDVALRLSKPLPAMLGSVFVPHTSPETALLILNLIYLPLLAFSFYFLLRQLRFTETYALYGVLWLLFAYPMLKYGLALSTDLSGWAWASATLGVFLYAVRHDKRIYLVLASVVGLLGILSKESVGLVFIFGFFYLLTTFHLRTKETLYNILAFAVPASFGFGVYMLSIISSAPSFIDWYQTNVSTYAQEYHTLTKGVLTLASTFHILWLYVISGAYLLWQRRREETLRFTYIAILAVCTTPVFLWPIFISRVLFIQYVWVIPLALYWLQSKENIWTSQRMYIAVAIPIVCSITLFLLSGGGSLFDRIARFF